MTLHGVAAGPAGKISRVTGGLGLGALCHRPGAQGWELRLMGHTAQPWP